jgi:pimeloyl-ACP methyl ester carboxylesterase
MKKNLTNTAMALVATASLFTGGDAMAESEIQVPQNVVQHKTIEIEKGVDVFYREAGSKKNPTVLLLHGFPTSSQMFRNIIPTLAKDYHVLAPDYPGYGSSSMPDRKKFEYSFKNFANIVEKFINKKEVDKFAVYLMDYGAPVGFRLFAKDPSRVNAFIIQNGNAYEEGLEGFWDPIKAYWKTPSLKNRDALRGLLTLGATKWQYTHGTQDESKISPDTWHHDQYLLDRKGNKEIQLDMFYDYRTNVALYPKWQKLFKKAAPPTLIIWGQNDNIFPEAGAHPYKKDIKDLETHIINAGHFLLEDQTDVALPLMLNFLQRKVRKNTK